MTAGCGRHKQKPNPRYHVTSRGEREGVSCVRREGEGKMRSSSRDQNVNRWKLFRYLEIEQQSKWVEGLEDNAQFTNCCSSFPFLLYLADADVGPLCMVWGCNKIFLYRPVIDTTAWHGDPTPQHNTPQHNAVRAFLYPHPPPSHLVTRIARISHPAWHFPQFEQLRQWRQHKASEWHCNTSNDTRGVLWGYNMPLMMGRGELARILLPTLKYYKGSIWPHSQSPDWGDVGAKWRL